MSRRYCTLHREYVQNIFNVVFPRIMLTISQLENLVQEYKYQTRVTRIMFVYYVQYYINMKENLEKKMFVFLIRVDISIYLYVIIKYMFKLFRIYEYQKDFFLYKIG